MSIRLGRIDKDKDEAVAYTFDWAADLNSSIIDSVSWSVPAGLTNQSVSETDTTSSIRVSGGTPGQSYKLECTATLVSGEILQAHIEVRVQN